MLTQRAGWDIKGLFSSIVKALSGDNNAAKVGGLKILGLLGDDGN
jgi:hypothetical protein